MLGTVTIKVDTTSPQKLSALRQRAHDLVDGDPDCQVVSSNAAMDQASFKVTGVDTKNGSVFEQQVEAQDADQAKALVKTKTLIPTVAVPA